MRTLLYLAAVLVALLSAAWFAAAALIGTQAEATLASLRTRGWEVSPSSLATTGFPSRFELAAEDVRLVAPDGQFAWEAPSLRLLAEILRPNRVTAVLPPEQRVRVAGLDIVVSAQDLRASATSGLSADLPLERATLESGLAALSGASGWGVGMDGLLASLSRTGPAAYDLLVEAEGVRPATVSANIGLLRLDARLTLDAPLDRRLGVAPRLVALTLREARLARGEVAVTGTGDLAPDAQGYLAGTVTLAVEDWRGLLDLLEAAGLLVLDRRTFLEGALEELAEGQDRIEVPVTFADGQIAAMGVVLLEAPRVL